MSDETLMVKELRGDTCRLRIVWEGLPHVELFRHAAFRVARRWLTISHTTSARRVSIMQGLHLGT